MILILHLHSKKPLKQQIELMVVITRFFFMLTHIMYIYTDAQHSNPLCRVTPVKDTKKRILDTIRKNTGK
jgi:hypothetical protein